MIKKFFISLSFILVFACIQAQAQVQLKLNLPGACVGIINPSMEVGITRKTSLNVEAWGVFAENNFAKTGKPFAASLFWGEFRYFPKERFRGFFAGVNAGWGVYRMNKSLTLFYDKPENIINVGYNGMLGATVGYQHTFFNRLVFEVSIGGGWSGGQHEDYDRYTGERLVEFNGTGEWLLYKAGVFLGYRFGK